MALCGDVYTANHSGMYDSFLLIPNANRLCSAMQTDLLLDSGVSAFSAMTLQQTGPLVSHPPHPTSDFCCCCAATLNPTPVLHGLKALSLSAWKPRSTVKRNAWKENSINWLTWWIRPSPTINSLNEISRNLKRVLVQTMNRYSCSFRFWKTVCQLCNQPLHGTTSSWSP